MLRLVFVLAITCAVVYGDGFSEKYARSKVMANCYGEENYNDWAKTVFMKMKECYHEEHDLSGLHEGSNEDSEESEGDMKFGDNPIFLLLNSQGEGQRFKFPFRNFREKRDNHEVLYDSKVLKGMMKKLKKKVGNFMCVLKKMNYIDEDFNLDFDHMKKEIKSVRNVNRDLKEDLIKVVDHCKEFTECVSSEEGPMPQKLKQIMAFVKCDKKGQMKVCMKHDIIKYLSEFDLSALPMVEDKDDGEMAEKLLHILWGVEASDDFQLY